MNNCERTDLLKFIYRVSFMVDDIALYLDTHPGCTKGLDAYKNFKTLRREAIKEYTEKYGPLNKYHVDNENCFSWVKGPWPWEGGCDC